MEIRIKYDKEDGVFFDEISDLRLLIARNELYFKRIIREIVLGNPVLTEEDLSKAVSNAAKTMNFEEVKDEAIRQLKIEGKIKE